MKPETHLSSVSRRRALATLAATALLAACGGPHPGTGGSLRSKAEAASYLAEFRKIDAANTGTITLDQATAYYTAKFTELDLGKKGFLVASDLGPMMPLMGAETADELHSRLDNNADGKVSLNEFLIIANWLFQKARANPNVLTLDEAMAAAQDAGRREGGNRGAQRSQFD